MIEIVLILILGAGAFVLTYDYMEDFYEEVLNRIRGWMEGFKGSFISADSRSKHSDDRIWEHLRKLLQLTLGLGSDRSVKFFGILSGMCGALVILTIGSRVPLKLSLLATALATAAPYGILRMKLQNLRIRSSREGELLITELLNNYKINYFNMERAIEVTAITLEDAPNSRRLLFNLSKGLNRVGTGSDISLLLDEFRLSINTSWGNILAQNMYFALNGGTRVADALGDLAGAVSAVRKVDEYSKRENNESRLMLKYLAPVSYVLTILAGIKYFGLSPGQYFKYQFETEVGLTWFTVSMIMYVTGIALSMYIRRSKLDF